MILKASNISAVSCDGETYEGIDGYIDLPISTEEAAAHGLVPATAEEAAEYTAAVDADNKAEPAPATNAVDADNKAEPDPATSETNGAEVQTDPQAGKSSRKAKDKKDGGK